VAVFPDTRVSAIRRAASNDDRVRAAAHETVAEVYWRPIYAYIRLTYRVPREDAEDLTQGFFADALRRGVFARYEPGRARFRTFVRTCVDRFVANERKAGGRLKRGGDRPVLSLDSASVAEHLTTESDPDRLFRDEWVASVFAVAVARLRERTARAGRPTHLALFERYDLEGARGAPPPSYAALAAEFGLSVSQVTNWLSSVRAEFREIVLDVLRELTGSDDEFRDEARALLGIDPS
jgi:DNA-directed RNA polymerase specialized sigma24 family protein